MIDSKASNVRAGGAMLALISMTALAPCNAEEGARYALAMSQDDSICKPLLAEYNRNIELDIGAKARPHAYPWPAPKSLAVNWQKKDWEGLRVDERVLEHAYTSAEADLSGDAQPEVVVRFAAWQRGDDRFTSIAVFPKGAVLPTRLEEYKTFARGAAATVVPGGYSFPKLKGAVQPTDLNDFDVIRFRGQSFVTGKTVVMDGSVELTHVPRWRIISRVRLATPGKGGDQLDRVLDSVCYFRLGGAT